ncbi:MAG: NAD(P)-binding protein [Acidobacteriota bacterium]
MGLLKKKDSSKLKKSMERLSSRRTGGDISSLRPRLTEKPPPCSTGCPSGNDVRGWLTLIAQREKLGLSLEDAMDRAWRLEVETNPFPAIMGRVCPHPCEDGCNRNQKDEAVAINSVERELGDWGIERGLELQKGPSEAEGERVAVVGAGPSGLSCAYQLARRGYAVTVFEAFEEPGGMLRYGIPPYRLPRAVLDAEIRRIQSLGVEIRCGTAVGRDVTLEELRKDFDAVFVGIGAHSGKTMGIAAEEGSGVYTGTEFLHCVNAGQDVEVGRRVVVIGGGDTAVDAARVSLRLSSDVAGTTRRLGSDVTILYRRTRAEMPAIDREIEEALEEGIQIEFLAAPIRVLRDGDGRMKGLEVQRMQLGEPDASGRRRPVPIEGDVYELEADTMITAVSQQPDWSQLGGLCSEGSWLETDGWGKTGVERVWSGGDVLRLGLATISIGQGRKAAEAISAALRGRIAEEKNGRHAIGSERIKMDYYPASQRAQRTVLPAGERLARPSEEADRGITRDAALLEAERCFSCGKCFGCESCWMYCQNNGFIKLPDPLTAGRYVDVNIALCNGCEKCADVCPCGYIDLQ